VKRFALAVLVLALLACTPALTRTTARPPTAAEMAQFWTDPGSGRRNLFDGAGGAGPKPVVDAQYRVLERDTDGFSITYKVRDEAGRVWHVKIGPEAQTEVVSSRIIWALGYHQVPSYFTTRWIAIENGEGHMLGGSRFRPDDMGLKGRGAWSWQENPFVGTRPYEGLLAVMMVLNSTDLKNDNNELYEVIGQPREGASRWYVVKDLGATLGETGVMEPRRNYIDGFEREPFITGWHKGAAEFGYKGRHQELVANISREDVRWACERLARLTDRQWRDAFRAGNYDDEITDRYIRRIRQKIADGLGTSTDGAGR